MQKRSWHFSKPKSYRKGTLPISTRTRDVITFGETMWRLSPPGFSRIEEAVTLDVRIGGSESNTAVALSRLGVDAAWWSKLPANALGRRIENEIRRWGIDTSHVLWDTQTEARAGLYFVDFGVPPRATDVLYDRARSSACTLIPEEIAVEPIATSRLLHVTGITCALSDSCASAVTHAVQIAKANGTKVSFDVNYRSKLWLPQKAEQVLSALLPQIDLLLCPLSDAQILFGMAGSGEEIAHQFRDRFGIPSVVITCGGEGARATDDSGYWSASAYELGNIVDRIGAGDAFDAGVLYGYLQGDLQLGMEYGSAMAALKHTIPGDLLLATRTEIEAVLQGSTGGVKR